MKPRSGSCHLAPLCAIVLGFAAAALAHAQDAPAGQGLWSISIENDIFGAREDGHYTHGTLVSHVPAEPPAWLADIFGRFPCIPCREIGTVEYVFGQNIFTPEDIELPGLQVNDRPYAGWLYAGISLSGNRETAHPDLRSHDTVTLAFGMVGPASLAEKAQKLFHKASGNARPQGWDHQLDNEPGVVLTYTRHWQRLFSSRHDNGLEYELSPHVVGALGNIYTYAGSGLMLRFGKNLRSSTVDTSRPGFPAAAYFDMQKSPAWFFFAGAETRAVARNIFLDGNTFTDSHSVEKKHIVVDLQLGLAIKWKKLSVTFSEVLRSKEFDGQDGADKYGAITVSFAL